jgi:signal transduction histidine kinase
MAPRPFKKSRLVLITLLVELATVFGLYKFSTYYMEDLVEQDIQQQLMALARYASRSINVDHVAAIRTEQDEHFKSIRRELNKIEQSFELRQGLAYLVEKDSTGHPVFGVMTTAQTFRGERYPEEIVGQIHQAFDGQEISSDLYTDRNGEFISVLVPLKSNGRVMAVLELDFEGPMYRAALSERLLPLQIGLMVLLVLPFTAVFIILTKLYEANEQKLRSREKIHEEQLRSFTEKERLEREARDKQMEAERRQAEALEEQKRQFFAMIVHDMRTPLTVIQLAFESLRMRFPDGTSTSQMDKALRQLTLLKRLVEDIAFIHQLEFSAYPLKRQNVALAGLLREVVDNLQEAAAVKKQKVKLTVRELEVSGDRSLLVRLTTNVLNNAFQHSPERTDVHVVCTALGDRAIINVENVAAVTLSERLLQSIFEPFVRGLADTSAVSPSSHLGLGLSISKAIVTAHGGTVRAHSENSRFILTISIPLSIRKEGAQAA